jgi:hypothetical protein
VDVRVYRREESERRTRAIDEGRIQGGEIVEQVHAEAREQSVRRLTAGRRDAVDEVHELGEIVAARGVVRSGHAFSVAGPCERR